MPNVGEYDKEDHAWHLKRRCWDIYVSGHPLEEYEEQWRRIVDRPCDARISCRTRRSGERPKAAG